MAFTPSRRHTLAGGLSLALSTPSLARSAPQPQIRMPGSEVLYDTHTHLFTADTDRYPVNIVNAREGSDKLLNRVKTAPVGPQELLKLWDENGVAGGVAVQYNAVYKTDNRFILDAADTNPGRLSPVVILGAADAATPKALEDFARQRGAVGLRLYGPADDSPAYPWLDSPAALDSWATADRLGLVMVVMYAPAVPSPAALGHFAHLADRFPNTTIAIDHFGWPDMTGGPDHGLTAAHKALSSHTNILFKFSSINLNMFEQAGVPSAPFLRRAVDVFGPGRIMWGSDYGNTPGPYAALVQKMLAATTLLTPQERRLVLHDNGAKVFARRTHA